MIEYIFLILIGFVAGAFGTIVGAGGGFILMPILLVLHKDWSPETLTAISLAMICGNSISGSWAYAKMKRINYYAGFWFAAAAIPGSLLGAYLTDYIPRRQFNIFFGAFLLAVSLYLVIWPGKHREHIGPPNIHFNLWIGVLMSFLVGIVSSILGLGGGIIHVPVMVYWLDFPVHIATATSHFVLALMTFAATVFHVLAGNLTGKYLMLLMLIIGVVFGAQLGAKLSTRISGKWIVRGLSVALMIAAVRILFMAANGK